MTTLSSPGIDPVRTRLRHSVSEVEREITLLTGRLTDGAATPPLAALLASWADLVTQLNLGAEPEVRECPGCGGVVMRAARLCGHCWKKLTPPMASREPAV